MRPQFLLLVPACLLLVSAVAADELPKRKAGLWEIKVTAGGRAMPLRSIQQCADGETDALMATNLEGAAGHKCEKVDIANRGGTITVDSICKIGSSARTTRAVITGDFNSAYTVAVTSGTAATQGAAGPGAPPSMTIEAKWLGPCKEGQRAGDVILPGGIKLNVRSLGIQHGAPPR